MKKSNKKHQFETPKRVPENHHNPIPRTHSEFTPVAPTDLQNVPTMYIPGDQQIVQLGIPSVQDEYFEPMVPSCAPAPQAMTGYIPPMLPYATMWRNNNAYMYDLRDIKVPKHNMYGYIIGGDGRIHISEDNGIGYPGIITGMAMSRFEDDENEALMKMAACNIVNTEDIGFRYVQCPEPGVAIDVGPVDHACVIGNINGPEGLFVPFCNAQAIEDGCDLLNEMMHNITRDGAPVCKPYRMTPCRAGQCCGDCANCKCKQLGMPCACGR